MNTVLNKITFDAPFPLESGKSLPQVEIAYTTYGTYVPGKSKVVWVCHALTANADVFDWWKGLFGPDRFFNASEYFIVCANIIGSCYGTTGPLSINPQSGKPYYGCFPLVTVRDLVKAHRLLADYLSIGNIFMLLGGSLGGQQAMEWAIAEPKRIKNMALLATNALHSPWGIAFNETQRMALTADASFGDENEKAGENGLKAARAIAMLSYRNYLTYNSTQAEADDDLTDSYRASSYQRYQGQKLANRFNAYSYWGLSKTMDSHHVGRGRGGVSKALTGIEAHTLIIGITTDLLFPVSEQQYLAKHIPHSQYVEIDSIYGHDGFLVELDIISGLMNGFLNKDGKKFEVQGR